MTIKVWCWLKQVCTSRSFCDRFHLALQTKGAIILLHLKTLKRSSAAKHMCIRICSNIYHNDLHDFVVARQWYEG